jgi:hypothetical protein
MGFGFGAARGGKTLRVSIFLIKIYRAQGHANVSSSQTHRISLSSSEAILSCLMREYSKDILGAIRGDGNESGDLMEF